MNAIRSGAERDIRPVVDQHARAMRSRHADGRAHKFAEFARGQITFADLNELTPGSGRHGNRRKLRRAAIAL
jgi:hypothetical protein